MSVKCKSTKCINCQHEFICKMANKPEQMLESCTLNLTNIVGDCMDIDVSIDFSCRHFLSYERKK